MVVRISWTKMQIYHPTLWVLHSVNVYTLVFHNSWRDLTRKQIYMICHSSDMILNTYFFIPSPTKLRRDIVTLLSVFPSILPSHPCEHSRINILRWILTKLGTYLVLKRIWNPIDFQGQRSRSPGQTFSRGDTPRFALPLLQLAIFC